MGVEQNDFRDMFSVYLSRPPQTQHMFGIFRRLWSRTRGLAGEERLKALPLQIFQDGDGGMYAYRSLPGGVPVFSKILGTWYISSSRVSGRSRRI